jgi:hypothetical protein
MLVQSPTVSIPLDEVVVMYAKEHCCEESKDKIFALRALVQEWRECLDPIAYQSDKHLSRRAVDLCFPKKEYRSRWTTFWYLWNTMNLGDFEAFKVFAKDYFSSGDLQNIKLEALPKPKPCRRKSIPVNERIEACRNAKEELPGHVMSLFEA